MSDAKNLKPKKIKATVKVKASKELEEQIEKELAELGEQERANENPTGND